MRESKADAPREAEIFSVGCKCDFCGKSLDRITKLWVWNEHMACSRTCAQRAQGNTNALASAKAFKQSGLSALNYGVKPERLKKALEEDEERDIDLL